MAKSRTDPYPPPLMELMATKSGLLTKAKAFSDVGMPAIAGPIWESAATYEERIAPLLEGLGHDLEAAVHRISAASCYRKAGDLTRAANLFRAALGGPLLDHTREEVKTMLAECLSQLSEATLGPAPKPRKVKSKKK